MQRVTPSFLYKSSSQLLLEKDSISDAVLITGSSETSDDELVFTRLPPSDDILKEDVKRDPRIEIQGCLGMIRLMNYWYLIVVTEVEVVGTFLEHVLYQVNRTSLYPVPRKSTSISDEDKKLENSYLQSLAELLDSSGFYFCLDYDLSHSLQVSSSFPSDYVYTWDQVDQTFFWNRHILEPFVKNKLYEWMLPVIDGYIYCKKEHIKEYLYDYILISRRGCLRTGARYHTRGADPYGNVANFVESEQIVISTKVASNEIQVSSFVQTRGSVPLCWKQPGKAFNFRPSPLLDDYLFSRQAISRHLETQLSRYKEVVLVSLLDQQGSEQELSETFHTELKLNFKNDPRVKFYPFDFHEMCRNNHYENLSQLLNQVKVDLDKFGFFLAFQTLKNPSQSQRGVFRTNCVDCLDRTNVVQNLFARYILEKQFKAVGIDVLLEDPEFEREVFKTAWVQNADVMSRRYTGTGALKTEYTKKGKQSLKGQVADGINSAKRILNKSWKDKRRQESIDLFLGKYSLGPKEGEGKGIYRWQTKKISSSQPQVLYISGREKTLWSYSAITGKRFEWLLTGVKHSAKHKHNNSLLALSFETGHQKKFLFESPYAREFFLYVLHYFTTSGYSSLVDLSPRVLGRDDESETKLPIPQRPLPPTPSSLISTPREDIGGIQFLQTPVINLTNSPFPNTRSLSPTPSPSPSPSSPFPILLSSSHPRLMTTAKRLGETESANLISFDKESEKEQDQEKEEVLPPHVSPLDLSKMSTTDGGSSSSISNSGTWTWSPSWGSSTTPTTNITTSPRSTQANAFASSTPRPHIGNATTGTFSNSTLSLLTGASWNGTEKPQSNFGPYHSFPPLQPDSHPSFDDPFFDERMTTSRFSNTFNETISICVSSWDMNLVIPGKSMVSWIPEGKDLYVFGVWNCNYSVGREEWVEGGISHWFYAVQNFLGPNYLPLATQRLHHTALFTLIRRQLVYNISNVEKGFVVKPDNTDKSRRIRDRILLFGAMRKTEQREDSSKNAIGLGLGLWYQDTALCFVHMETPDPFPKVEEFDMWHDFSHVFMLGPLKTRETRWINLLDTVNLLLRPSSSYPRNIEFHHIAVHCQNQPCSIKFKLETTVLDYTQLREKCTPYKIELQQIRLADASESSAHEYFLKFHAPFLHFGVVSSVVKQSELVWKSQVLMPFITAQEYLKQKHIVVECWQRGSMDDELVGIGLLPLSGSFDAEGENFQCRLSLDSEFTKTLHIRIQTREAASSVYPTLSLSALSETAVPITSLSNLSPISSNFNSEDSRLSSDLGDLSELLSTSPCSAVNELVAHLGSSF